MDNWTLGSTMIGIGLNWWQSILVVFGSQCISSIAMALNSREGEVYHIGYPIVARSVFGLYGAYYVVAARAILAVIWFAVKLYIGSSLVDNMLTAVFWKSYTDIPNHVPASIGFTTQQFLAFFLYWLVHIPFTLLRPFQLRWLFTFKMFTVVPACFGLFIFCMVNTHAKLGHGLPQSSHVSASSFSWFIMYAINAGLGNTVSIHPLLVPDDDIHTHCTGKSHHESTRLQPLGQIPQRLNLASTPRKSNLRDHLRYPWYPRDISN